MGGETHRVSLQHKSLGEKPRGVMERTWTLPSGISHFPRWLNPEPMSLETSTEKMLLPISGFMMWGVPLQLGDGSLGTPPLVPS